MTMLVNIIIFLVSAAIVWFFAGIVIEAVGRIARRFCKTGFFTAFFILGSLTSISEVSVAVNSSIAGVPGVSVGNLAGASLVILLLIVPVLAIAGRGITLNDAVSKRSLLLLLCVVALPSLLLIDGNVTKTEGLVALLAYGTVAYALCLNRKSISACDVLAEKAASTHPLLSDIGRILIGGIAIFAAAHFLVEQAVYFSSVLSIPASLVGLLLLSIGTNIPELVIAIRSVLTRKTGIALGDYLGSAAMNTFIFGWLAISNGTFLVESSEFFVTTFLLVSGLLCFYVFARSKAGISRGEGIFLLLFYVAFLIFQFLNVLRLAGA